MFGFGKLWGSLWSLSGCQGGEGRDWEARGDLAEASGVSGDVRVETEGIGKLDGDLAGSARAVMGKI